MTLAPAVRARPLPCLALFATFLGGIPAVGEEPPGEPGAAVWGVELQVPDVAAAAGFYADALGFAGVARDPDLGWALLRSADLRLLLSRSSLPAAAGVSAGVYLNLTVSGLETARAAAAAAGGTVEEPVRESAVGPFLVARDPAGHPVHLIDHPWDGDRPAAAPPAVFNIGAAVVDMAEAEAFYTGLGFAVATRDYLPETLVFARQGGTSLVLHPHADRPAEATARRGGLLVLTGPGGFGGVAPAGWRAAVRGLRDPSGNPVRLGRWEDGPPPPAAEAARAAFDRLAALAGRWRVESSKGWSEEVTFELIARGSAVVQRTRFAASPEETMITVFHLDGDRLMLTHYCEARNQPRLVATEVTGDRLVFELLDATSLASRDQGHMDRAVYELGDDGGFTSRWTWYQGGEERWLEEIVHRRVAGGPAGGEGER